MFVGEESTRRSTTMTNCECCDHGCPHCRGGCKLPATETLYRVDMEDETGLAFCEHCAADANESGLFSSK